MKEFPIFKFLILLSIFVYSLNYFKEFYLNFFLIILISLLICLVFTLFFKLNYLAYIIATFTTALIINHNIINSDINYPNKLIPIQKAILTGKIINIIDKDSNLKLIIRGDLDAKSLSLIKNTKVILKISELESLRIKLRIGDIIYTTLKIRAPHKKLINQDFDEIQYFRANNYSFYGYAKAKDLVIIDNRNIFDEIVDNARVNIKFKIYNLFSKDIAPIALALITGDKSEIDFDVKRNFSFTGTAHLLAVSGTHVGIIATIIFVLLGMVFNQWIKLIIFSICIISFVILTGNQPSAIRAGLMSIVIVFSRTLERDIHTLNSLSLVALIMLLVDNNLFYSPGFQMSVGSVLGILLFYKLINNQFKKIYNSNNSFINYIYLSLAITISASIVVTPIVAYFFNIYSIVSPLANLIEIPIFTISMIGLVITIIFSYIYFPLAQLTSLSVNLLLKSLLGINNYLSKLDFAYISGDLTFIIAILTSISILYLLSSNTLKLFIFRLTTISFVVPLIYIYSLSYYSIHHYSNSIIIPTSNYIYTIDDTNNKVSPNIYIFDRKPKLKPFYDKYLTYIIDNYSKPKIYFCGNYGIALIDYYKNKSAIYSKMLSPDFSDTLTKYLKLKDNFIQHIDYEN